MRALLLLALAAAPLRAQEAEPLEAGAAAFAKGDYETAADRLADALFAEPGSKEARRLLRESAAKLLEAQERRIEAERLEIRCRLALATDQECSFLREPPEATPPVFIGPPTPPAVAAAPAPKRRLKRRKGGAAPAVVAPPEEKVPTAADREMSRVFYYQGLKAYAEHELGEAKVSWRKALELDPQNDRARQALARMGETP